MDSQGELKPEHAVVGEVAWSANELVSFAEYEAREAPFLGALVAGKELTKVLDAEPFPRLEGTTWSAVADELLGFQGSSRGY